MNTDHRLLDALGRANPVLDPDDLVDSDAADELAMRKPDSVLDWSIRGEDYVADGYRIRLLEPGNWEITHQGANIAYHQSRKAAFSIVERHRREAIRRRDLIRLSLTFVLAIIAGGTIGSVVGLTNLGWVLALCLIFYIALSSFIRFFAVFARNLNDPYRRPLPWERPPWRERMLGRR